MATDTTWPQNLLIWAGDSRFLEEVSKAWVAQWGGEAGAVNLGAAGLDPGALGMELNTLPMWSERQVVRLRQAEESAEDLVQSLARYLGNPAPSTALLIEYTGDLDPKKKHCPALWKPILEKLAVKSCEPRGGKEYIARRLRTEGLTIAPAAAEALDEWARGELGRLVSALDLLCLYKLGAKRIEEEDLDALLGTGGTPKEWDLQDAFLKGDKREFLALSAKISADPDCAPLMFVGMLAKQLRSLLLLHGHEARGAARQDITPKELGFGHPFPAQKLVAVAGKWPEARVRKALGVLFELDLDLKGHPGNDWTLVESHLLKVMPKQG